MKRALAAAALALGAAAVAGAGFLVMISLGDDEASGVSCPGEEAGACIPDLAMEDRSGEVWDQAALEGQVVVVNFWATWCRPCLEEIPELAEVHDRYGDRGVVVLGVMMDRPGEEELEAFIDDTGLNYPVVPADQDIVRAFGYPDLLPTTYVYGRAGERELSHQGVVTADQLSELLGDLLAEHAPDEA